MFTFKVDGADSIDKDFEEFNHDVSVATTYGLKTVASELTPALQRHIRKDVYEAYKPQRYERRFDNPQYGRSIFDAGNMNWNLTRIGGRDGVEFTYEPNGRNTYYPNSDYYVDSDSLITVLQEDRGYLWFNGGGIGTKRPFWNNFVDEVVQRGDQWFVAGFNQFDPSIRAKSDRKLVQEASDYMLDPTGEIKSHS